MNNLTLYGNNPFDLIDRFFSNDDLFYTGFRTPAVDISEEDNRYLIEAELPGLSEKDVKLELKDGILYLSTAKKESKEEKSAKNRWLRRERREFQFSRSSRPARQHRCGEDRSQFPRRSAHPSPCPRRPRRPPASFR
jgi:HSP20 family molecular chaperone IbpA